MTLAALLAVPLAQVPVEPGREQGRQWAVNELSGREYEAARPGVVERAISWVLEQLSQIPVSSSPATAIVLGVVLAVVGGLVVWAVARAGGLRRTARRSAPAVHDRAGTTAAEHRALADRHAAAGDWPAAVLERFRAVARVLEEQAILAPQPGRTALELSRDAGAWLPDLSAELAAGAAVFDDVAYGHRRVGAEADERLARLDDAVRRARPVAAQPAGPVAPL